MFFKYIFDSAIRLYFFFFVALVEIILTSSSFGASGVMCLLNNSKISSAVKFFAFKFTDWKPAVSVCICIQKKILLESWIKENIKTLYGFGFTHHALLVLNQIQTSDHCGHKQHSFEKYTVDLLKLLLTKRAGIAHLWNNIHKLFSHFNMWAFFALYRQHIDFFMSYNSKYMLKTF